MLLCLEYEVFFGMFFAFWISARKGPFMFQNIISSTKAAKKRYQMIVVFLKRMYNYVCLARVIMMTHFNEKMQVSLDIFNPN